MPARPESEARCASRFPNDEQVVVDAVPQCLNVVLGFVAPRQHQYACAHGLTQRRQHAEAIDAGQRQDEQD